MKSVAFKHFIKNLDVLVQLIETDKAGYRNELEILTRKILLEIRATLIFKQSTIVSTVSIFQDSTGYSG